MFNDDETVFNNRIMQIFKAGFHKSQFIRIYGLRSVKMVPTYENLTSDFIPFLVLIYRIYWKKQNFSIPWEKFRSIPNNSNQFRRDMAHHFHILRAVITCRNPS